MLPNGLLIAPHGAARWCSGIRSPEWLPYDRLSLNESKFNNCESWFNIWPITIINIVFPHLLIAFKCDLFLRLDLHHNQIRFEFQYGGLYSWIFSWILLTLIMHAAQGQGHGIDRGLSYDTRRFRGPTAGSEKLRKRRGLGRVASDSSARHQWRRQPWWRPRQATKQVKCRRRAQIRTCQWRGS